ncbi:hypothetical protein AX16_007396 [Volvariella volvacea WC 439]|nr:hypothetical protein AX16_007396 [Volvariella volvacea WC 439]
MASSASPWVLEQARIDELITAAESGACSQGEGIEAELTNDIITLRRRRNMLTPLIAQLPTEMICRIISFHMASAQDDSKGSTPYQWIKVTHVASHLRQMALAEPSLWTSIYMPAPDGLVHEFFRRSKTLPLDIWIDEVGSRGHLIDLFRDQLPRTRSIFLSTSLPIEWTSYFSQLTSLRHISLRYTRDRSPDTAPPRFPAEVEFATLAIELNECSFTWTPSLFNPQMTSLVITRTNDPVTTQQLCDTLATLPRLQKLHLIDVLTAGSWPRPKVALPQLRELALVDNNLVFLGGILASLTFPSSASISISHDGRIVGHLERQDPKKFAQLFLNLAEHFSQPLSSSAMDSPPKLYNMLILHQLDQSKFGRFSLSAGKDWLKLSFRGGVPSNPRTSAAFLSFIQKLPMSHLMNLDLRGSEDSLCASIMPHLLSYAPSKIEQLNITGTLTKAFLSHVNSVISEAEILDFPSDDGCPESQSMMEIITTNPSCKELISSFPGIDFSELKGPPFAPSIFIPTLSLKLHISSPLAIDRMSILLQDNDISVL